MENFRVDNTTKNLKPVVQTVKSAVQKPCAGLYLQLAMNGLSDAEQFATETRFHEQLTFQVRLNKE